MTSSDKPLSIAPAGAQSPGASENEPRERRPPTDVAFSPGTTARGGKLESLQALRAIAAVAVMFFHGSTLVREASGYELLGGAFRNGFSGVDLFFVLSGFIIYHTTADKAVGRREFLRRRFLRIYPIYWLILSVRLVYLIGFTPDSAPPMDAASVFLDWFLLPKSDYLIYVAWTLCVEVAFYLVFAATFFVSEKLFLVVLGVWGLASAIFGVAGVGAENVIMSRWMFSGVAEFFYGVMIAVSLRRGVRGRHREAALLGVLLGGLSLVGVRWWGPIPLGRELSYGVPAALIVYGAVHTRMRFPRWAVLIGDASYVLYLIHVTAISNGMKLLTRVGELDWLGSALGSFTLYGCVVVLACVAHLAVERPLGAALRGFMAQPRGSSLPSISVDPKPSPSASA